MKKPLRLLYYCIPCIVLLTGLVIFWKNGNEGEEKDEKVPGVLRSMDLWSDMRTYPHKTMDKMPFYTGFEEAREMSVAARNRNAREFSTTTAPWTALAPKNFAGRVISLGFHPTNANVMWVGSAAGGLWKTTTGGTGAAGGINWTYVPTGYPVLGVMSIAVHPTDGNTLYIGTGEVYNSSSGETGATGGGHIRTFRGTYGIGILKTTDGGTTWTRVLNFDSTQLKGVADILIHPTNTNIVFAATTDGVYRTTDAGANWTLIHNTVMAMDLCFKPGSPSVLYVACGNFNTSGRGIYKTTNSTAATPSFAAINSGLPAVMSGKIALAISASAPNTVFASIGRDPNVTGDPFAVYYSTDEGSTWTLRTNASTIVGGASSLGQGWYAHDIAVSPISTDTVYWSEMDLWRSVNVGVNYTRKTYWNQWNINYTTVGGTQEGTAALTYAHADIHRIYISPFNPRTIFLCTDGGIFKSTNNGDTFIGLNGGLMTAQIYPNMGQSMQDPNFMIGGLQDNEGFVYSGSAGCRRIGALGDGFHSAINPRDDDTCYIASYYLNVKRSLNRGTSWTNIISNGNPPAETACFNAPYVFAPSNPLIMYAGTYRIKKSTNAGSTWSNISGTLSNTSAPVLYIAVAPSDANTVYVSVAPGGGARSKLFKSTNGGSVFTEITGTLPDRYYSDIAVDAANPNRVAVSLSGFGSSHVFLSRDGGTTWSDIDNGNLPDVPHNTLMFDPNNRRTLYVGNDLGVFYAHGLPAGSGALPATTESVWTAYNEGVEDAVLVSDLLATATGKLRMATFGRGLWERDLAPSSILPFVFKNFSVRAGEKGNELRWTISSQSDIDRYDVEYSNDAVNFSKVGTVTSSGTSGDVTYDYFHPVKNEMDGFYRIKIIDKDGTFEYSVVQSVKAQKLITKLYAYPSPTTGRFRIRVPSDNSGDMNLKLYDNSGKLVMAMQLNLLPGVQESPVDITKYASGTYQLVCEGKKAKWTTRIIKK
ncbi:MAG TPA: T9SS type A sorting domain-containing protein [Chitinophagaceae bacterium]